MLQILIDNRVFGVSIVFMLVCLSVYAVFRIYLRDELDSEQKKKLFKFFGVIFLIAFLFAAITAILHYGRNRPGTALPETNTYAIDNATDNINFEQAKVHRIIDGDTIEVILHDRIIERIRFIGIDTPERGEEGFIEATDFVSDLIPIGSTVYLEARGRDRDNWGRLRRIIWFEDESSGFLVNLNHKLLDYGYAVEMIVD